MKNKILKWIKEHEFNNHQGGYLIHADDLETFINNLNWDTQTKPNTN